MTGTTDSHGQNTPSSWFQLLQSESVFEMIFEPNLTASQVVVYCSVKDSPSATATRGHVFHRDLLSSLMTGETKEVQRQSKRGNTPQMSQQQHFSNGGHPCVVTTSHC